MDIEIQNQEPVKTPTKRRGGKSPLKRRRAQHIFTAHEPVVLMAPSLVQKPHSPTRMYRRIALGFTCMALLALGGLMILATQEAYLTVHTTKQTIHTTWSAHVGTSPKNVKTTNASSEYLPGTVATISATAKQSFPTSLRSVAGGKSSGMVTLINNFSKNQSLVATTRLLSKEGMLFRITKNVLVPAKSNIQVAAIADKEGKEGDIGPTTFTIPGLWIGLQDKIYATSSAPMQGGSSKVHVLTEDDIARATKKLGEEATAKALQEFHLTYGKPSVSITELGAATTSTKIGAATTSFDATLSAKLVGVVLDQQALMQLAAKNLAATLKPEEYREFVGVKEGSLNIVLDSYDEKTSRATLKIYVEGETKIAASSPLLRKEVLLGKSMKEAQEYFAAHQEFERVDITLAPFWNTLMPLKPDNISIDLQ